jgi:hypothetical protein
MAGMSSVVARRKIIASLGRLAGGRVNTLLSNDSADNVFYLLGHPRMRELPFFGRKNLGLKVAMKRPMHPIETANGAKTGIPK